MVRSVLALPQLGGNSAVEQRRVVLQSFRAEPPADAPLAGFEAVHGRVGCCALPDAKRFSDLHLYGQQVEPATLPAMYRTQGSKLQRLKGAPPCETRRPMGVPTDDPSTQQLKKERTRTQYDLIGVSIEREALRHTPLERQKYVVRPGFREKGIANQTRLRQMREEDERRHVEYRNEVANATRRRLQKTRHVHAQGAREQQLHLQQQQQQQQQLGMQQQMMMQQRLLDEHTATSLRLAYRQSVAEAAELAEATLSLSSFERAREASRAGKRRAGGGGTRSRVVEEDDEDEDDE